MTIDKNDFKEINLKINQINNKFNKFQIKTKGLERLEKIINNNLVKPNLVNKEEIKEDIFNYKEEIKELNLKFLENLNKENNYIQSGFLEKIEKSLEYISSREDYFNLLNDKFIEDYNILYSNLERLNNNKVNELETLILDLNNKYNKLLSSKNPSFVQISLNYKNNENYNDTNLKILKLGNYESPYDISDSSNDFEIISENNYKRVKINFEGIIELTGLIKLKNLSDAGKNFDETQLIFDIGFSLNKSERIQEKGFIRKNNKKFIIGDIKLINKILKVKKDDLLNLHLGKLEGKSTLDIGIDNSTYINLKRLE